MGIIVHYREAVGRSGKVPIPAIVSLHRLLRKALPVRSTSELVLVGRAETQVADYIDKNRQESLTFEVGEEEVRVIYFR